ncbi:hypothetical protein WDV93_03200 [Pantoea ananatis]
MKTGFSLVAYFIKLALLMSGLMLAFQASAAPVFLCASQRNRKGDLSEPDVIGKRSVNGAFF